jgi:hypothetical protein
VLQLSSLRCWNALLLTVASVTAIQPQVLELSSLIVTSLGCPDPQLVTAANTSTIFSHLPHFCLCWSSSSNWDYCCSSLVASLHHLYHLYFSSDCPQSFSGTLWLLSCHNYCCHCHHFLFLLPAQPTLPMIKIASRHEKIFWKKSLIGSNNATQGDRTRGIFWLTRKLN